MITVSSEYALRAVIYLAQHADEWPIPAIRIAADTDIPRKYLSKVLADLVRADVLGASPGRSGGFRFARPPSEILLHEVFAPFEPVLGTRRPCPFGNELCSDDDPCAGHDRWVRVRETYTQFLHETSVLDVTSSDEHCTARPSQKRKKR